MTDLDDSCQAPSESPRPSEAANFVGVLDGLWARSPTPVQVPAAPVKQVPSSSAHTRV